jgi:hypothetical protein
MQERFFCAACVLNVRSSVQHIISQASGNPQWENEEQEILSNEGSRIEHGIFVKRAANIAGA